MDDIETKAQASASDNADTVPDTMLNDNEVKDAEASADSTATETVSVAETKPKPRRKSAPKLKSESAESPDNKITDDEKTPKKKPSWVKKAPDITTKSVSENLTQSELGEVQTVTVDSAISPIDTLFASELPISDSPEQGDPASSEPLNGDTSFAEEKSDREISEDDSTRHEAPVEFVSLFNTTEFEPETVESPEINSAVENQDTETDDEENEITPPDELFAYRKKNDEEIEELIEEADDDEDIINLDSYTPEPIEENVDDDGQYHFPVFDQYPTAETKKADNKQEKYDPKKPRSIDRRFDLVELFVFTLLAVMIITTFFFRHSIVDGDSMKNTLHSGEHLIISDFLYTPKRGDIIVCEDYTTSIKKPIVKRVIAIEGDRVRITAGGDVYVNDKLLDESAYIFYDGPDYTPPVNITVGENELFVMGDHRNDSEDSRSIGPISEDAVLGKVILRFYPFDKFGTVN